MGLEFAISDLKKAFRSYPDSPSAYCSNRAGCLCPESIEYPRHGRGVKFAGFTGEIVVGERLGIFHAVEGVDAAYRMGSQPAEPGLVDKAGL